MNSTPLRNWIPYRIIDVEGQQLCQWLDTFGQPFTEPFFDETITKCRLANGQHARPGVMSAPEMIAAWAESIADIVPAMIIFHVSRCGSTLISQMFTALPDFIVLPEVPFFDEILRVPFKSDAAHQEISQLFRAAVKFYMRQQNEKRLIVKTDSWHLFFYEQLREMYPATPFIFLYRRPEEVYASQRRQPGMHAVPGIIDPEIFGFSRDKLDCSRSDIYFAGVLERYFGRMMDINQKDNNTLIVNYHDGPIAMMRQIVAFAGILLTEPDWGDIEARSGFHSKRPDEKFIDEPPAALPPFLEAASALYRQLDEQRKKRLIQTL